MQIFSNRTKLIMAVNFQSQRIILRYFFVCDHQQNILCLFGSLPLLHQPLCVHLLYYTHSMTSYSRFFFASHTHITKCKSCCRKLVGKRPFFVFLSVNDSILSTLLSHIPRNNPSLPSPCYSLVRLFGPHPHWNFPSLRTHLTPISPSPVIAQTSQPSRPCLDIQLACCIPRLTSYFQWILRPYFLASL